MPLIDLVRFRFQMAELVEQFADPAGFVKEFLKILDLYSRRALKPGATSLPSSLLPAFNCHPQVMKLIRDAILPSVQEFPEQAISTAGALWEDDHLESRELAATILGNLPPAYAKHIETHIHNWAHPDVDNVSLDHLLEKSIHSLQINQPKVVEEMIISYVNHQDPAYQRIGLKMMEQLVRHTEFTQFPMLFKHLSRFISEDTDQLTQLETTAVVAALVDRSPVETTYFLRQLLFLTPGQNITRTIKRYLPFFTEDLQEKLALAIKNHQ